MAKKSAGLLLYRHREGDLEVFLVHPGGPFWAKKDAGTLVCGEVSSINDDNIDNRFYEPMPRFAEIEEDEPIGHILCNEYEKVLGK